MLRHILLAATAAAALTAASAGEIDIQAGRLLAVPGKPALTERTVIVKDGRIVEIRAGYVANPGATVVDLRNRTVLPGLIDLHVHLTSELSPKAQLQEVTLTAPDRALDGVVYARRTVEAGFTTVRDLGGDPEAILALRDAIKAGKVEGPRIMTSASMISITGGHGDSNGFRPDLTFDRRNLCDGADACAHAVREMVKLGGDVIKFAATGGVLSNVASGTGQHFSDAEMKAIVETAHNLGRTVAVHAHGAAGIKAALRSGVDTVEHGTYLDDEAIALFRKTGAALVPTVLAGITVAGHAEEPGYFPPAIAVKAKAVGPLIQAALGRAYKGGVRILFGTDSGVSNHGQNAKEFALMVGAGIPAAEAIRMATVDAAKFLGLDNDIGTIEHGKVADIIAVEGDPEKDVTILEHVGFVMKGGVMVKGAP